MPKKKLWLLAALSLIALAVPALALAAGEGGPLKLGARNPSPDESQSLSKETEIIASTTTYGTRQSNKSSDGGGAIYGCRSKAGGTPARNEPCVRSNNLADGLAFEFETDGAQAGTIVATGGDNARPFTTNATGVATGLNADRVDSKSADDLTKDAVGAVSGQLRFAAVDATGKLAATRGAASATRTAEGTYRVVFTDDVSACVFQATPTAFEDAGPVAVGLDEDKKTVTVRTRSGGGADGTGATAPADRPFHLAATCL